MALTLTSSTEVWYLKSRAEPACEPTQAAGSLGALTHFSLLPTPLPALLNVRVLVVDIYFQVIFVNLLGFVLIKRAKL